MLLFSLTFKCSFFPKTKESLDWSRSNIAKRESNGSGNGVEDGNEGRSERDTQE